MSKLAILGGTPVRQGKPDYPSWPIVGETEVKLVDEVTRSMRWWRYVEPSYVEKFEKDFAAYHDSPYAVAVTNGTAALEIALQALEYEPGDEVIVPPYTFFATASCVLKNNLIPVFVDIDPKTYNLDPNLIEQAITPRTRAIIPVHFAGIPAHLDKIMAIAKKHNLAVIEDCAHAHGAIWDGKKVGSHGEMGCFSFQQSKNMTAGEGGIILAREEKLYKLCFSYHFFGREEGRPFLEYHRLGSNHRLTEFQAAVLLGQLERVEDQTQRRAENGAYLSAKLAQIPGIIPVEDDNPKITRRAYHLYVFKYIKEEFAGVSKDRFIEALNAEGIPIAAGYVATVYQNPVFQEKRFQLTTQAARDVDYTKVKCPAAEQAVEEALFMPHANLLAGKADMDDIVEAIAKIKANAASLR